MCNKYPFLSGTILLTLTPFMVILLFSPQCELDTVLALLIAVVDIIPQAMFCFKSGDSGIWDFFLFKGTPAHLHT